MHDLNVRVADLLVEVLFFQELICVQLLLYGWMNIFIDCFTYYNFYNVNCKYVSYLEIVKRCLQIIQVLTPTF